MAEKSRKIKIETPDDDPKQVSFEAADAIPRVMDDLEDEHGGRQVIDLDAPVEDAPAKVGEAADSDAPDFDADDAPDTTPAPTTNAPAASSEELDALRKQVAQANDNYLRALADLQNFRRRGEEERRRIIQDGNERLIMELLPVLDDFDLALTHAQKAESYEQLVGGVDAILRKFRETLAKQGVEPIPAQGEMFDAGKHEAVMLDEESDAPDETITAELRKGYTMNQRVIRPSLVKVAKAG